MKHISKVMGNTDQSQTRSASTFSEIEREVVRRFFAAIKVLYGAARYQAAWPSAEAEREAMRVWAPDIINLGWTEASKRLTFAKSMMHQGDWRHPDVALILNGNQQPGASGIAAASYKPASEALAALPAPPRDKSKGQAMLDNLRAELDAKTDEERQAAKKRNDDDREMLARLEQKHLPYGKYQRPVSMGDGSVQYVATDIDHPEQDHLMELSR